MENYVHKKNPTGQALIYALALVLLIIPSVSAEGVDISVNNQSVAVGSTMILPVSLRNAEELSEINLEISYDPAVLKFVGIELGEISRNGIIEATESKPGTIVINMADTSGISQDGEFMKLSFNVTGADGSSSPISITSKGLRNLDKNDVSLNTNGGTVLVNGRGTKAPLAGYITVFASALAMCFFILKGRKSFD